MEFEPKLLPPLPLYLSNVQILLQTMAKTTGLPLFPVPRVLSACEEQNFSICHPIPCSLLIRISPRQVRLTGRSSFLCPTPTLVVKAIPWVWHAENTVVLLAFLQLVMVIPCQESQAKSSLPPLSVKDLKGSVTQKEACHCLHPQPLS